MSAVGGSVEGGGCAGERSGCADGDACCVAGTRETGVVCVGGAGAACAGRDNGRGDWCGTGTAHAGGDNGMGNWCGVSTTCAGRGGGIGAVDSGDTEGGIDGVGEDAAVEGAEARAGIGG